MKREKSEERKGRSGLWKRTAGLKACVVLLFGSAFLCHCARQGAPQGGPKDSLPPVVMWAQPAFNTTNFNGKRIYIAFDEYVQLKDQQKEFFTSPAMKNKPTLLVKGRGVQIDITDTLKPNTTYALNFGSSLCDNNEANPLNGFRYVFSTGPEIDSMFMSGYTVDAYTKDSVSKTLLFFYDAADSAFLRKPYLALNDAQRPDSVPAFDSTLFTVKPAFIARAENNGIFIAQNLKPIDYRVYAFEDTNSNFTYEPGVDKVGFLEGVYNPASLPDFLAWFDTTRMYMSAEPQIYLRMFLDKTFQRQNLSSSKRPLQHKVDFYFGAAKPRIDTLVLEGIDSARIIPEHVTRGRDPINLWPTLPSGQLPDTIKGRITYWKHDSINQLQPVTQQLALAWKYVESKEEIKEREKQEREKERAERAGETYTPPEKPNPFKYDLKAKGDVNPEENISISFDYPIVEMDSARISLIRYGEGEDRYRVKYNLRQDTLDMKRWILSAAWTAGQKYELVIPDSVFLNVAGERNDSIKSDFTIMSPEKFGTLTVNVKGKTEGACYVLQLLNEKNALLQEKKYVRSGVYTFRFVAPGNVKLRIIEDVNANGEWDSGDLLVHRQPEQVEIYVPESGDELIVMKANWDIEITVDMARLFRPFAVEDIRRQLRKQEMVRLERLAEERKKKMLDQQQKQTQQMNSSSAGAFNPTGGFN